jgi:lipopolysaccharide heptosyltransferase II
LATLPSLSSDIDELILFKRDQWNKPSGWFGFLGFLRDLKRRKWDYVIDVQGLFRSGLSAWFAGNGNNVYGFADAREGATFFYDHKVKVPNDRVHAVDKNLYLIEQILGGKVTYVPPEFTPDSDGTAEVNNLLEDDAQDRPLVAVAVGSRWPSKNWPPAFFADVIDKVLTGFNASVVLIGSPGEVTIGQAVQESSKRDDLVNLIGKTSIGGMVEVIRRSTVLMTNDSGPMHIAAAMSIPTVTFFGPTAPDKTGPYGSVHTVFTSKLDCSPCFNRTCPLPKQTCLSETVTPQDAADAIVRKLQEASND